MTTGFKDLPLSGSGGAPSGSAGGELAGTYPNPTLVTASVTGKALTGYVAGSNTALAATDTILQAFQKAQGQVTARALQIGVVNPVAALSIDLASGTNDFFTKTITTNSTFTITNVPSSGVFQFLIEIVLTSGSITWWSGIKWPGGAAPSGLATGVSHVFGFYTRDGGTTYVGWILEAIA
jgi:hypothetical protein